MQADLKITCVITTFNRRKYIARAIESVLNQTYQNIEVIVVDDCSADDTADVVRGIRDPRLRYWRQPENRGACQARNRGVELSTGDYVGFLDDDDVWLREKAYRQAELIRAKGYPDWVFGGWEWVDEDSGQVMFRRIPDPSGRIDGLPRWAFNIAIDYLVKREVLIQLPSDIQLKYYVPCDQLMRLEIRGERSFLSEVLVRCTSHHGPRTSDSTAEIQAEEIGTLFERYGKMIRDDKQGCARFKLILGACLIEMKRFRCARRELSAAILCRPAYWRNYYHYIRALRS